MAALPLQILGRQQVQITFRQAFSGQFTSVCSVFQSDVAWAADIETHGDKMGSRRIWRSFRTLVVQPSVTS